MNRFARQASFATAMSVMFLVSASAHELRTAKTCKKYPVVENFHYTGDCLPKSNICASSWKDAEAFYKWKESDRLHKGTIAWNCHGRTFANRSAWIHLAEPYLACDSPFCPAKPKEGDAIIWWKNGVTSHSVTIVGPWKNLDTIVMSKYGAAGQYKHRLKNVTDVYGSNWAVTNFGAKTKIYSNSEPVTGPSDGAEVPDVEAAQMLGERLLAERVNMPWYVDVLASEESFQRARAEDIRAIGALRPAARENLEYLTDDVARADVLLADLEDQSRYAPLSVYNLPEPELLSGLVASEQLGEIASRRPDLKDRILWRLRVLALDPATRDETRAVAISTLAPLLDEPGRNALAEDVSAFIPDTLNRPTYTGHSLQLMKRELDRRPARQR